MPGLWVLIAVLVTVGAEARCSIGSPIVLTHETNVALLVTATPERAPAGIPDDPDWSELQVSEVPGWRFRVLEVVGEGGGLEGLSTVLVVPWGYDAGCFALVWDDDNWVPPGDTAVFLFSRDQLAGGGEPVVHVLGWHRPFPHGELLGGGMPRSDWLSAREYLSLLRALPVVRPGIPEGQWAREVLRVFENGPPEWSEKYPGSEILRRGQRRGAGTDHEPAGGAMDPGSREASTPGAGGARFGVHDAGKLPAWLTPFEPFPPKVEAP
jgi:hypothetical protein